MTITFFGSRGKGYPSRLYFAEAQSHNIIIKENLAILRGLACSNQLNHTNFFWLFWRWSRPLYCAPRDACAWRKCSNPSQATPCMHPCVLRRAANPSRIANPIHDDILSITFEANVSKPHLPRPLDRFKDRPTFYFDTVVHSHRATKPDYPKTISVSNNAPQPAISLLELFGTNYKSIFRDITQLLVSAWLTVPLDLKHVILSCRTHTMNLAQIHIT